MPNQKSPAQTAIIKIDNVTIEKIRESFQDEAQTTVHCNYVSKRKYVNGGWVNIYPTTYLIHHDEKLQLLHAENIPMAPQIHVFKRVGELKHFTLIFPPIPKDWETFSLIEKSDGQSGFIVSNIKRNNSRVYDIALH
jgi:hypothetical protein